MNWKCPQCGSDENLASELRCTCGNEISEELLTQLQVTKVRKKHSKSLLLRDAVIVIVIAFIIAAALHPFADMMPPFLQHFVNHESTLVGYLVVLWYRTDDKPTHIWKVSLFVWLLLACLYSLAFMHKIGTQYTADGIIIGVLTSELISVAIAVFLYGFIRKLRTPLQING